MADFELKKYEIVKPFGSYRKGQFVAFNGAHAKQFAEFIKECVEEVKKPATDNTQEKSTTLFDTTRQSKRDDRSEYR